MNFAARLLLPSLLLLSALGAQAQSLPATSVSAGTAGRMIALPGDTRDAAMKQGSIFFVGNATVIIRYAGFTILTDPNFLHKGDHAHLGYGLKSQRLTDPAINFEKLPPIDFVLLSHYHGDHFDRLVEKRLDKATRIVSTPEAVEQLKVKGFSAGIPLGKWETVTFSKGGAKLKITSTPGRHGPPLVEMALPEVMGSMLDFQDDSSAARYRLYISGDTLVYDEIKEIPKRFQNVNLALLHLGGTRVAGVLVTMDAKQGVEMLQIIAPKTAIPIHYNDYDVFKSPLSDFINAVKKVNLEHKVKYLKHGETYEFSITK